jgi:hypothetical protein
MSAIGTDPSSQTGTGAVTLGLRANWRQFALLVLINAFVGGMAGIERTVVPLIRDTHGALWLDLPRCRIDACEAIRVHDHSQLPVSSATTLSAV